MKINNYSFTFKGKSDYKDLAPVFPDILKIILEKNGHFQNEEDEESVQMFIELNMIDIELNRKPEGYNRKGKFRLVFPIGEKGFYVRSIVATENEMKDIGEDIAALLKKAKIKFDSSSGNVTD